VKYYYNLF